MKGLWFVYFLIFLAGYGLACIVFLISRLIVGREIKERKSCKEMALDNLAKEAK